MMEKQFWVLGGIFRDTTFKKLIHGTDEVYGPFSDYNEALKVWKAKIWLKVDICEHRLFIIKA